MRVCVFGWVRVCQSQYACLQLCKCVYVCACDCVPVIVCMCLSACEVHVRLSLSVCENVCVSV